MDFFGIDYDTILAYTQKHDPKLVPILHFLFYIIPPVLYVCGVVAKRLPEPGYQIQYFSDYELLGKVPAFLTTPIDKLVNWANQFVIFLNYILNTRPYLWFYKIMCKLGRRMNKKSLKLRNPQEAYSQDNTPIDDLTNPVTADNLTAGDIKKRAQLLSSELEKAAPKVTRAIAAQRVQADVIEQSTTAPKPQDPSHG